MTPLDKQALSDLNSILYRKIGEFYYDSKDNELEKTLSDFKTQYGEEQTTKIVNHDPMLAFRVIYSDIINNSYKLTYTLYKYNINFKVTVEKNSTDTYIINYPLSSKIKNNNALISPLVFLTDVITSIPYARIKDFYGTKSIKLFYVILKNSRIDEDGVDSGLGELIVSRIIEWKIYSDSVIPEYVSVVNKLVEYLFSKGAKSVLSKYKSSLVSYIAQFYDENILTLGLFCNIELLKIILKYNSNYELDKWFIDMNKMYLNKIGKYVKSEKDINDVIELFKVYNNYFKNTVVISELVKGIFSSSNYDIKTKLQIRNYYKDSELNSITNILERIEN